MYFTVCELAINPAFSQASKQFEANRPPAHNFHNTGGSSGIEDQTLHQIPKIGNEATRQFVDKTCQQRRLEAVPGLQDLAMDQFIVALEDQEI